MHLVRRRRWLWIAGLVLAPLLLGPAITHAVVQGKRPQPLRTFKVFGNAAVTGNTLMSASPPGNVNDILLPQNSASIGGVPFDGKLVSAYVWWTGSTAASGVDRQVDFTLPNGTKVSISADSCDTIPAIYQQFGFFYCRKDVTSLLSQRGGGRLNGTYVVGNVQALTGQCPPQGGDRFCQARYAAWSMVLVWESPTHTVRRDIVLYDGFLHMDENNTSGITSFSLSGFKVGNPPRGSFTFFGLEGDSFLGSPPEPASNGDFISFRSNSSTQSTRLSSSTPFNPPGNLWNSTISLGVDIDTFNIGSGSGGQNLLKTNDTSVTLVTGTGDGIVPGGNGESVFLGYVLMTIETLSPNFRNNRTSKRVSRLSASVGDILTYTLRVANTGSLEAKNTIVQDSIPANTTYIPNSTRVGSNRVADVAGTSPLVRGLNLGTIDFRPNNNEREVTFQVRITGLPANRQISNNFTVKSDEVGVTTSNTVVTTIQAPQLGTFQKTVTNQTNPNGPVRPGDRLRYTISLSNSTGTPANGIQFVDDMPKFVKLLSVAAGSGQATSSTTGGANGTGRVEVRNVSVPGNGTTRIFIDVQVFSEAEFRTAGIAANQIDGQSISNQGEARVSQLSFVAKTDDPGTPAKDDPTIVRVSYRTDFTGSVKAVRDNNGGRPEPGDTLTYTVTLRNRGTRDTTARWEDSMPPGVGSYRQVAIPAGSTAQFQQPPAGGNQTGLLAVTKIPLKAGATATITFTVVIASNVRNGTAITNVGTIFDEQDSNRKLTISSPTLRVVSGPLLDTSTKTVASAQGQPVTTVAPGATIRYTITVINSGNRPATDVVVTDTVPTELDQIRVGQGGRLSGSTITWNRTSTAALASIAPNGRVTLTFTARVKVTSSDGTLIRNQAFMQTPGLPNREKTDDPNTPLRGDPTVVRVSAKPTLAMTKTVRDNNGGTAQPGDVLTYTLVLRNTGTGPATDVVVSDTYERNKVTNVRASNARLTPGAVVWDKTTLPALASLAAGASVTLTFTAQIISPLASTTITNQATVASKEITTRVKSDDPAKPGAEDPTTINVVSSANPRITKAVRDQNGGDVAPGDVLVYTITIEGRGNAPLLNVTVQDDIVSQLTQVQPGQGGRFSTTPRPQILWNATTTPALARINPGQSVVLSFTTRVAAGVSDGTVLRNQAFASGTGLTRRPSDDPSTPAVNDSTNVTVRSRPDLSSSTKTVTDVNGGLVLPGDLLSYTITVRNTGNVAARNVVVSDVVANNLLNITPGNGGTLAGRTITWRLASLSAGGTATVTFTASVRSPLANGTVIANQAFMTATGVPRTPTDDPTTAALDDSTKITVTSGPAFADTSKIVTDVNGGQLIPGDRIRYTIVVRNSGTDVARNVVVTDRVDTTKLNQIVPGQGGRLAAGSITWSATTTPALASIPVNGSVTLTFDASVLTTLGNGTVIENQAFVRSQRVTTPVPSDDPGTVDLDDTTKATVVAGSSLANSTKAVRDNNGGSVQPGDILTYTIVVRNSGTGVANNVVVRDPINGTLLTAVNPTRGRFSGGAIVWDQTTEPQLAAIAQGQSVTLTFTARVAPGLLAGTRIPNQATMTATDLQTPALTDDPSTPALDDPTVVVVGGQSQIAATKTVQDNNGGSPEPGDTLTYTLVVRNTGNAQATNVVVTDVVDQNLEQVNVLAGGNGTFNAATNTATWRIGNVAPGASVTLRFTARVKQNVLNGTRVTNQGLVAVSGVAQPIPTDNPNTPQANDSTDIVINSPLRVTFTKTARDTNGGPVRPGDTIEYTITATNSGRSLLTNAVITDRIDANLAQIQPLDGGTFAGGVLTWRAGNITAGATARVRFRAVIVNTATNGTRIPNQANLAAQGLPAVLPSDDPNTPAPNDPTVVLVSFPDLSNLTKEARDLNGGTFEPGDSVEYKITVRNSGTSPLTNVVVTDAVNTTWLEQIQPRQGGTFAGGTITWNGTTTPALRSVAGNGTFELFFVAKIKANAPNGTVIGNQAVARSTEVTTPEPSDDPSTPANNDITNISVRRAPNLSQVTKTFVDNNGGAVRPGDTLTYTITIRNIGSQPARNVTVTDPVNARLTNVQAPGGTFANGTITWNSSSLPQLASIAPNTQVALTFTAVIDLQTPNNTVIPNQATVRTSDLPSPILSDDPNTPLPNDPTNVTVRASADLSNAQKTVRDINGGSVAPGDILEYTIVIRNRGNTNAFQARVTDPTPANTEFVSGSVRLNGVVIPDGGTNPLIQGVIVRSARSGTPNGVVIPDDGAPPDDEAATIVFRVRVRAGTAAGTRISNQGTVFANGQPPAPTTEAVVVVGGGPDLNNTAKVVRISNDQQTPGVADVGDELEYTITIRNSGQGAARNVILNDAIPANSQYVPSSIRLNGNQQTDGADSDAGRFQAGVGNNGTVTVNVGVMNPGDSAVVRFRVLIQGGQRISNQGIVQADNHPQEGTDADDNDSNGDQPTVVPVGRRELLTATKAVVDVNGGNVNPGDVLEYRITLLNSGSVAVANIQATDVMPANTTFQSGSAQGAGTNAYDAATRTLTFSGLSLNPGESTLLLFRVQINAGTPNGTKISNKATISAPPVIPEFDTNTVEVEVQEGGSTVTLTGRVFQDFGSDDTNFDPGEDEVMPGFKVKVVTAAAPDKVVAEAIVDEQGQYKIENLKPGEYLLQAFSERDVQFEQSTQDLSAGGTINRNILIEPTGRLYNSKTGTAVVDARVFLVYDDLTNTACTSDSSCGANGICVRSSSNAGSGRCGEKVADTQLLRNQQGQATNSKGLYKFSATVSQRNYRIVVRPAEEVSIFPSNTIPPQRGVAAFASFSDNGKVVAEDKPNPGNTQQPKTYFLRFSVLQVNQVVQNNHIPIDLSGSLLVLNKKASVRTASVGDIVTYTLELRNGSAKEFKYDPIRKVGGVYFTDIMPNGFRLLRLSPRLLRSDGKSVLARVDAGAKDGKLKTNLPRRVFRFGPFDVPGRTTVTLKYQVVVGRQMKTGEYINVAYAHNAAGGALTEYARAMVRIVYDPIFDQGTVIGKVYCDKNKNRKQDSGDLGVAGVRIYLDTGFYVTTDANGQYHFQAIDPGNHMLKLDTQTLPPGTKMVDTPDQVLYISRGLMRKVNFAVSCSSKTVGVQKVFLKKMKPKNVKLVIQGDINGPRLTVNKKQKPLPVVDMALGVPNQMPVFTRTKGVDFALSRGRLAKKIVFSLRIAPGFNPLSWQLDIYKKTVGKEMRTLLRTFKGVGLPPLKVEWDGKAPLGRFLLKRRHLYMARFTYQTYGGAVSQSPWRLFGVEFTKTKPKVLLRRTFRADWMGRRRGTRVRGRLRRALRRLRRRLRRLVKRERTVLEVEVHHDNRMRRTRALFLTVRRAASVRRYLKRLLRGINVIVRVKGYGSSKPLMPNITRRNRRKNRRIILRVVQLSTQGKKSIPAQTYKPRVSLQGKALPVDARGRFSTTIEVKPKVVPLLQIMTSRGAFLILPLRTLKKKAVSAVKLKRYQRRRLVRQMKRWKRPKGRLYRSYRRYFRRYRRAFRRKNRKTAKKGEKLYPDISPSMIFRGKAHTMFEFRDRSQSLSQIDHKAQPVFRLYLADSGVKHLRSAPQKTTRSGREQLRRKPRWVAKKSRAAAPRIPAKRVRKPLPRVRQTTPAVRRRKAVAKKKLDYKMVPIPLSRARGVQAARLKVTLPPQGSVLRNSLFVIRGETHPANKLKINGQAISVSKKGKFVAKVKLKHGQKKLHLVTTDSKGNRGEISWPVNVNLNRFFLMGFADTAIAQDSAKQLEGFNDHSSFRVPSAGLLFHGRAVLYTKGYLQGKHFLRKVFKTIKFTAHLDTAKKREQEEFYKQLIDPEKFYPIYGDNSKQVQDVTARNKVYILVEADRSKLLVGNFRTQMRGHELKRYERTFYGVDVDFKKRFAKNFDTRARFFVSDGEQRQLKAHIQLRGTAGSLYYLKHRQIIEGSEQIRLTVRDRDSGIILAQIPLTRNQDYVVQYFDGRLFFKYPVPSVVDSFILTQHNLNTTLDGNPVYIEVDYEYEAVDGQGGLAFGVRAEQGLWDKVRVGFSYVQEGRAGGANPYSLWGFDLALRWNKTTYLKAEYARSSSFDSQSFLSTDGGLSYNPAQRFYNNLSLDRRQTRTNNLGGNAVAVRLGSDLGKLFKWKKDKVGVQIRSYFTWRERGFFAAGQNLEQGSMKGGILTHIRLLKKHSIRLKYDGINLDRFDLVASSAYKYEQHILNFNYTFNFLPNWDALIEYSYTNTYDQRAENAPGNQPVLWGNFVTLGANWRVNKIFHVLLRQQLAFATVSREPLTLMDHFATTLGLNLRVYKDTFVSGTATVRWSGNLGAQIGLKTQLNKNSRVYVREQINYVQQGTGLTHTLVVGAEKRLTRDTRLYGEYQLDGGMSQEGSRAVVGLSHIFHIFKGFFLGTGLEYARFLDATRGNTSRTVGRLTLQYTGLKRLKVSGRYEVRYDDADNNSVGLNNGDRIQFVTVNNLLWKLTPDVSFITRFNYAMTFNSGLVNGLGGNEAELLEFTTGLAYRPVKYDWVNLLLKFTTRRELRPIALNDNRAEYTNTEVLSLMSIFELPFKLQVVEQFAVRFRQEEVEGLQPSSTATIMWINRLNFHLLKRLDIGVEYRLMWMWQASAGEAFALSTFDHGLLVEASYNINQFVYVGVGYNFSIFTDNLFADPSRDYSGFFLRVVGKY